MKKYFAQYVGGEEGTLESKSFVCCTKSFLLDIILNIVITIGVSAISCGCFFAVISSYKNEQVLRLPKATDQPSLFLGSKVSKDNSMSAEKTLRLNRR